jgi:hypothetical protein
MYLYIFPTVQGLWGFDAGTHAGGVSDVLPLSFYESVCADGAAGVCVDGSEEGDESE